MEANLAVKDIGGTWELENMDMAVGGFTDQPKSGINEGDLILLVEEGSSYCEPLNSSPLEVLEVNSTTLESS